MAESAHPTSVSDGTQKTASSEYPICEVIQVEESELKKFREKQTQHKVEAVIPEGLKVAEDAKPKIAPHAASEADLKSAGPTASEVSKSIVERYTTQIAPTEFPYSAAGVLFVGVGGNANPTGRGTAMVVGLNNMIVTAATIIPFNSPTGWWARFVPGYHDGIEPFGSAWALQCHGFLTATVTSDSNYVVIRLDSPIGQKCGVLGCWESPDSASYLAYQNWNTVGYPYEAPIAVLGLPIERDDLSSSDRKLLFALQVYNAVADPGWYGAPMYGLPAGEIGGPYIIAVLSGNYYYDKDEASYMVYVGGSQLLSVVQWGMEHWA